MLLTACLAYNLESDQTFGFLGCSKGLASKMIYELRQASQSHHHHPLFLSSIILEQMISHYKVSNEIQSIDMEDVNFLQGWESSRSVMR